MKRIMFVSLLGCLLAGQAFAGNPWLDAYTPVTPTAPPMSDSDDGDACGATAENQVDSQAVECEQDAPLYPVLDPVNTQGQPTSSALNSQPYISVLQQRPIEKSFSWKDNWKDVAKSAARWSVPWLACGLLKALQAYKTWYYKPVTRSINQSSNGILLGCAVTAMGLAARLKNKSSLNKVKADSALSDQELLVQSARRHSTVRIANEKQQRKSLSSHPSFKSSGATFQPLDETVNAYDYEMALKEINTDRRDARASDPVGLRGSAIALATGVAVSLAACCYR